MCIFFTNNTVLHATNTCYYRRCNLLQGSIDVISIDHRVCQWKCIYKDSLCLYFINKSRLTNNVVTNTYNLSLMKVQIVSTQCVTISIVHGCFGLDMYSMQAYKWSIVEKVGKSLTLYTLVTKYINIIDIHTH